MSRVAKRLKHPLQERFSLALDLIALLIDAVSLGLLAFTLFIGNRAIRFFRQSRQAINEAASLLEVIVNALTSRIEVSESVVNDLRSDFATVSRRTAGVETEQARLRANHLQLLRHLQEALTHDRRLILELQQLKTIVVSISQYKAGRDQRPVIIRARAQVALQERDVLSSLTPTERRAVEILAREGPKAAPDLGRRLRKSREHMARLMKRLYFEGYVDRETNRAPFRYKLNDAVRSNLGIPTDSVTEELPD